jgi:hypothetical protein
MKKLTRPVGLIALRIAERAGVTEGIGTVFKTAYPEMRRSSNNGFQRFDCDT